jgi:hypothetical protein
VKKSTKVLLVTAAVTTAVGFVIDRLLTRWYPKIEKAFVRVDDIESCLREATVAEMQNELAKRQAEGDEIGRKKS